MAGCDNSVLGEVIAHPAGHSCLASLSESAVLTGGCDGELGIHEWRSEESKFTTKVHRRIHKGAVLEVVARNEKEFYSVGEDCSLYGVRRGADDTLTGRLVYRSTLPLRLVSCSLGHESLACFGDEMKIVIVNEDSTVLWASDTTKTPLVALAWSGKRLVYADEGGRVVILGENFETTKSFSLSGFLSKNSTLAVRGRQIFLCCRDNGLFVLEADTLTLVDHIKPPASVNFLTCHLATIDSWLLCHSRGLTFVDPVDLDLSPDSPCPVKDIIRVSGISPALIFAMTNAGVLTCISSSWTASTRATSDSTTTTLPRALVDRPRKQKRSMLDSEEEEDEEGENKVHEPQHDHEEGEEGQEQSKDSRKSSKDGKEKRLGHTERREQIDDFDEFDDYDVDGEAAGETQQGDRMEIDRADALVCRRSSSPTMLPQCIHRAFQPSSTPFIHGYAILCWNSVGVVISRQDSGYHGLEVEFHDKNFHRPIRFIDEVGYTMGSVGKSGAIFASRGDPVSEVCSKIYVSPVDLQDRSVPWAIELPNGEDALGVAIGGSGYCIVATSRGYLRSFTPNGLQGLIINHPGRYVSMVANDHCLALFHADEFSSEVGFVMYDLTSLKVLRSGAVGGAFQKTRVTWIGLGDSPDDVMAIFDERSVLHLYSEELRAWQPWLDCSDLECGGRKAVWPISVSPSELQCLRLAEGERYPEAIPRPLQTVLPFQIPLIGVRTDPSVKAYEHSLRHHTILSPDSNLPHSTRIPEKELKRLKLASDKHVLELIQLALKADRPGRVLELCPLFMMEKSWELAIQLVKHHRMVHLADRIETVREKSTMQERDKKAKTASLPAAEATASLRTPRIPKRIAAESPSTTLANLTPTPLGESLHLSAKPVVATNSFMNTDYHESLSTPLCTHVSSSLANPLSKLSFAPPSTDREDGPLFAHSLTGAENATHGPVSFVDMLKNVQTANKMAVDPKKAKVEPTAAATAAKTKKQTDLDSALTKKPVPLSENHPFEVNRQ